MGESNSPREASDNLQTLASEAFSKAKNKSGREVFFLVNDSVQAYALKGYLIAANERKVSIGEMKRDDRLECEVEETSFECVDGRLVNKKVFCLGVTYISGEGRNA